jgi:peptide-methionine (S)-S-oxide reductase
MNFKHLFILLFLISLVTNSKGQTNMKQATFGAGCFWCVEAIFQDVKGVESVESGYSGGHIDNPTYEQVCSKKTGHAEVIRINYDESVVDFNTLLEVFWHTHNPTTLNRQGADVGPQYRSVIYFHDDEQKEKALASRKNTDASGLWNDPIVTEISPLINYYVAEKYHQDYYTQNPNQGYCSVVIAPKVAKFRKQFKHLLKEAH